MELCCARFCKLHLPDWSSDDFLCLSMTKSAHNLVKLYNLSSLPSGGATTGKCPQNLGG